MRVDVGGTMGAFVQAELRRLWAAFLAGLRGGTLAYAVITWVLVAGNLAFDGSVTEAPLHALVVLVIAAGYLLLTGTIFGAAVGVLAVCRAMVGAWAALPLLALPAGVALALALGGDLLAARAQALHDALAIAASERDWLVSDAARAAHAGPIVLVVLLPLLFLDLGTILLDPSVLLELGVLVVAFAGLVLAGAGAAALVATAVVGAVYLRRARQRWLAWSRQLTQSAGTL